VVDLAVLGLQLDLVILEVFCNLNGSMILYQQKKKKVNLAGS